jgi:hypothetical protein
MMTVYLKRIVVVRRALWDSLGILEGSRYHALHLNERATESVARLGPSLKKLT